MPACCVAANCNNSQTTPGITMHELPRNRPALRRKWIKFIQFKRSDFLGGADSHAHLCLLHKWALQWVRFRKPHGIPVLFQNPAWQAQTDTAVFRLVGLSGKVSVSSSSELRSWPFCSDSPEWRSRRMVTWFGRRGEAFGTTRNAYFRAFITPRSQFPLHHRSRIFSNGNCIKNHP